MDLKQFEFFSFFDSRAAERLAELSEMLEIKKGGFIFREGDASDGLYILVDGKIEICREDASGKRFQIALVEPNSYFGEFGVLDGQPRSAAAAAVEDSVLAKISNTDLEKIFAQTSAHSIIRFAADIVEKFRKSNAKYMEERLRQERISMVGQMVGEIIHDYRNPFAVIALATEILGKKTGDEETVKFAGLIAEQVTRMQSMTDELLEFSRGETRFSREAVQVEDFLSHYELLNREYLEAERGTEGHDDQKNNSGRSGETSAGAAESHQQRRGLLQGRARKNHGRSPRSGRPCQLPCHGQRPGHPPRNRSAHF